MVLEHIECRSSIGKRGCWIYEHASDERIHRLRSWIDRLIHSGMWFLCRETKDTRLSSLINCNSGGLGNWGKGWWEWCIWSEISGMCGHERLFWWMWSHWRSSQRAVSAFGVIHMERRVFKIPMALLERRRPCMTVANAMISLVGEQTQDQTLSAQLVPASSAMCV